jgi:hypothetical protein
MKSKKMRNARPPTRSENPLKTNKVRVDIMGDEIRLRWKRRVLRVEKN